MQYAIIFLIALISSAALVPFAQWLSHRWGIVAVPGGRRQHTGHIPRLGGIPICIGYCLGIALIYMFLSMEMGIMRPLRGVLLGTLFVFIGGLLDDWLDLSFRWQLLIQVTAALIANYHVAFLERISNPTPFDDILIPGISIEATTNQIVFATPLAWFITAFWIVGMINAINWLDGLDGLAAGVGAIACALFAWHTLQLDQQTIAAFPIALAGALLGFLLFNFAPARIYLGSAGVYILAYNLATLAFLAPAKMATALMVLALPLMDGVWRIIDRIRDGRNPFSGDRRHLHFLLRDYGLPVRTIVIGYYLITITLGTIAVFGNLTPSIKLLLLAIIGIAILLFLILFTRYAEKRIASTH